MMYKDVKLTTVNDCLYLLVSTVGEIGQRPACVCQDFTVVLVEEKAKRGQTFTHHLKLGGRVFVAAQVGNRPGGVTQETGLQQSTMGTKLVLTKYCKQRKAILVEERLL